METLNILPEPCFIFSLFQKSPLEMIKVLCKNVQLVKIAVRVIQEPTILDYVTVGQGG